MELCTLSYVNMHILGILLVKEQGKELQVLNLHPGIPIYFILIPLVMEILALRTHKVSTLFTRGRTRSFKKKKIKS